MSRKNKSLVVRGGDPEMYDSLSIAAMDEGSEDAMLFYALVAANKHGVPQAFFDVCYYLRLFYPGEEIRQVDSATANLAIRYLLEAKSRGHAQATELVNEYGIHYDESSNQRHFINLWDSE